MISENLQRLINLLIVKTTNGKAIWNKTSSDNEFKLELEKGSITTDNWFYEDTWYTDIRIRNDRGDEIDSASSPQHSEDYNAILKLYNAAKKSYYNVDETIEDIFKELGSDKTVGKRKNDDLPF